MHKEHLRSNYEDTIKIMRIYLLFCLRQVVELLVIDFNVKNGIVGLLGYALWLGCGRCLSGRFKGPKMSLFPLL